MTVKSLGIEPIKYNGPIADFRGWMDRFLSYGGIAMLQPSISQEEIRKRAFNEQKGNDIIDFTRYCPRLIVTYSEIDESSNREVWYVTKYDPITDDNTKPPERWATILAIETFTNNTIVEFLDGVYFRLRTVGGRTIDNARARFIGDEFSSYAKLIKDEWGKRDSNMPSEEVTESMTKNPKVERISPIQYSGSVAHFRACMDRFLAVNGEIFKGEKDTHTLEYHIGYFTPAHNTTREVWNVYIDPGIVIDGKSPGRSHFGMILAVEDQPNRTIVEFVDGHCYERTGTQIRGASSDVTLGPAHLATHEPIGDDFIKIAQWVLDGLNENLTDTNIPDEPKTRDLMNDWFPYFHRYKDRIRITLRDIATKTNYNYDYVRQQHANYIKGLERE